MYYRDLFTLHGNLIQLGLCDTRRTNSTSGFAFKTGLLYIFYMRGATAASTVGFFGECVSDLYYAALRM